MPNHVTHRCTVRGPEPSIQKFKQECFTDGRLDFNLIIPMPELIQHTGSGSRTFGDDPTRHSTWYIKNPDLDFMDPGYGLDNERPLTPEEHEELRRIGHQNWYDWSIANWGTKWNAYSFNMIKEDPDFLEFLFDTAWSSPKPVFLELHRRFPELLIGLAGFDEGWGFSTCAVLDGPNGVHFFDTREANDKAYELVHGHPPEREADENDPLAYWWEKKGKEKAEKEGEA